MATTRVLVEHGQDVGYANIDPDHPLVDGLLEGRTIRVYKSAKDGYILQWDDEGYGLCDEDDVAHFCARLGRPDLLAELELGTEY